jgi:hypothetical protein
MAAPSSKVATAPSSTAPSSVTLRQLTVESDRLTISFGGGSEQLQCAGVFSDGRVRDLTHLAQWTIQDPTVATLDAHGIATPVAAGTTGIQASFAGLTAQGTLSVAAGAVGTAPAAAPTTTPDLLFVNPSLRNLVDPGAQQQLVVLAYWKATGATLDVTRSASIVPSSSVAVVDSFGVTTGTTGTVTFDCSWQGARATAEIAFDPAAPLPNGDAASVIQVPAGLATPGIPAVK